MSISNFKFWYELSPISLVNGIATGLSGNLPILYLLQPQAFPNGPLSGAQIPDINKVFAHFMPLSGATLIENEIAEFPLANQAVAANAIITKPLHISLKMTCPADSPGGYMSKLATLSGLQNKIAQHISMGGVFNVATPSFPYNNALLLDIVDVTGGDSKQTQIDWQWDFELPLLTLAQAQQVQNNLMSKLGSGQQVNADQNGALSYTGLQNTTGNPQSLGATGYVPSAQSSQSSASSGNIGPPL